MRLREDRRAPKLLVSLLCNWGQGGSVTPRQQKRVGLGIRLYTVSSAPSTITVFSFPGDSSGCCAIPSGHCTGSDLNISRSYTCPDFLSGSPHRPLSDINPSNCTKTQNRRCLSLFKSLSWVPTTYNKMPWTEVPRNQKNARAKWSEDKHDSFAWSSDTLVDLVGVFLFLFSSKS